MVVNTCQATIDVWGFITLASGFTVTLISILYVIGKLLTKSELEGLAKKELLQFFISLLIVIGAAGLASIICQVIPSLVKDVIGEGDQFSASYDYLNTLIYKRGIPVLQRVWTSAMLLNSFSNIESKSAFAKIKYSPSVILKPFSKALVFFTSVSNILLGSLQAQLVFLQLAEAFALTLILPMGLILRTVPGLRKGGSYLIAFSFGFYVVLPLMYVMNYAIFKTIDPDFNTLISVQVNPLETFKLSSDIINIFKYFDEFAIILPQAIFLPLLNLTITIAFISSFAEFLSNL